MPDKKIDESLFANIARIEVKTRKMVNNLFSGNYQTVFKGDGMEFDEVRQYQPGDDIRAMDWNVTARNQSPFIKVFKEERELTLFLMVDLSRSGHFGSTGNFKVELSAEICAALAFSAIKNGDRVGLLSFTDRVEHYIAPGKGRGHVLRLIRDVLNFEPEGTGTDISMAIDYMARVQKKKAIVFLISDFIDNNFEKALRATGSKHDLIAIHISDPIERELPKVGRVALRNAETGKIALINSDNEMVRDEYKRLEKERMLRLDTLCAKASIDLVRIDSAKSYVEPLIKFFRLRERRSLTG